MEKKKTTPETPQDRAEKPQHGSARRPYAPPTLRKRDKLADVTEGVPLAVSGPRIP